jgi:hypothetical protein
MSLETEVWKDIVPIPQDDGPDPLAPIAYEPECKLIFFKQLALTIIIMS